MKIEKVHLVEVDNSLPLLQPSRTMEIKTSKGLTTSPIRCATSYEFNRKAELPTETTIDNPVSVYTKKFTGGEIIELLTTNKGYNRQLSSIEKIDRITEYSILHVCAFQLYETAKNTKAPLVILQEGDNLEKFLRFMIGMQYDAKHEIISIPALNLPLSILKTSLKNAERAIEKLGKQAVFSLDLGYNNFPEVLKFITSDLQTNFVNLIYRKRRNVPQHYEELRKYASKDIAFLMTDVDRIDFDHEDLSTMHYMPFLGNDLFAVEIPAFNIPKKGKPKPKTHNLANLKIFNNDDLVIEPVINHKISNKKIIEQLGNPSSDELEIKLENLNEAKTDDAKYKIINALTRVHELKTSSKEFATLTDHVKERSSIDYVKSKKDFEKKLSSI